MQRERLGEIVQLEGCPDPLERTVPPRPGRGGHDQSVEVMPTTPVSATNLPFIVAGLPVTSVIPDTSSLVTVSGMLPYSDGPSPRSDAVSVYRPGGTSGIVNVPSGCVTPPMPNGVPSSADSDETFRNALAGPPDEVSTVPLRLTLRTGSRGKIALDSIPEFDPDALRLGELARAGIVGWRIRRLDDRLQRRHAQARGHVVVAGRESEDPEGARVVRVVSGAHVLEAAIALSHARAIDTNAEAGQRLAALVEDASVDDSTASTVPRR